MLRCEKRRPYPTIDLTQNPIRVEKIREPVVIQTVAPANPSAGTTTKPATGNFLYLSRIGRYYSLPDDVELIEFIVGVTCSPVADYCPAAPIRVYKRGDAEIAIDAIGRTSDDWPEGDSEAFPFFFADADRITGQ